MTPGSVLGVRALDAPLEASVVTAGTFDGVHLGHRALVDLAVARARADGLPALAYTFHPHPAKLFAPARAPALLVSVPERVRALRAGGIETVIVEPFDAAFAELTADAWVEGWLHRWLRPRLVVVGFNFSYGKSRGGDPDHLRAAGLRLGFDVSIVDAVSVDDAVVSSTLIRDLLLRGEVEAAARLLGRDFALTGSVVHGDHRGRTIGFPTANLALDAELVPAHGVYATIAELADGARHPAITNIGVRPTFQGHELRVETHLLDFAGDLYGQALRVELVARIREERRFAGPDALVAQIRADVDAARRRLQA